MAFRFHRSVKVLPGIRLNFGKRGISTSIGVRGAYVTFGGSGTRTTVGLPGSGLSYTHLQRPQRERPTAGVAKSPADPEVHQGSALRGFMWIVLIGAALLTAIDRLTTPEPPVQMPDPALTPTEVAAQTAARKAREEGLAEIHTAVLGVTQIHHAVANSKTLSLYRVTRMPSGTICYQLHLRNSHGVPYVRSAMMEGAVLKVSGSEGFDSRWINRCTDKTDGRDITAEVVAGIRP